MPGPLAAELIAHCCPAALREVFITLLDRECAGSLPGVGNSAQLIDRIQLAALCSAEWNLDRLRQAVALARRDWRDLLVQSGFGADVDAHKRWQQQRIAQHGGA